MKEITKTETAKGNETEGIDHVVETGESDRAHDLKNAEIEKEVAHPKKVVVLGEENLLFIGMCPLQALNILLLYR